MNKDSKLRRTARWIWGKSSALVALLLILIAFVIGYRLASPDAHAPGAQGADPHAHDAHLAADAPVQYYTCSMHPSVRLTDPNAKCPICHMDLIPVEGGSTDPQDEGRITLSEQQSALSAIETVSVERYFPLATERLYGKITYDQTTLARISAYFPGRIEKLYINFTGVPVQEGDHLAEIYSPELIGAFEELRQASLSAQQSSPSSDFVHTTALQTLKAVRDKLRLFGIDAAQIDRVEHEGFDGDAFTIRTPMGGVVTEVMVREGDYLRTGQPIATIADLDHLWLDLQAYESQLPFIRWGQAVEFTVESHPGETFSGRISFIEPLIDPRTRTAAVRVAVENQNQSLKPGMFASAVITPRVGETGALASDELVGRWVCPMHPTFVRDAPGACAICHMDLVPAESMATPGHAPTTLAPMVIPAGAVLFTGTRSVVYVAHKSGAGQSFEARRVTLGPRAGDFYIVRDGLSEGERVVSHGAFRVDSAMQIAAKPSMMMLPQTHEHTPGDAAASATPPAAPPPPGLGAIYDAYLGAQRALSEDDLAGYNASASALSAAAGAFVTTGLDADAHDAWREARGTLTGAGPGDDLNAARDRFHAISRAVIALAQRLGHEGDHSWSVVHCPMAFDFEGADWLQASDEIANPYFGSGMLRCGEIIHTLAPSDAGVSGDGHE